MTEDLPTQIHLNDNDDQPDWQPQGVSIDNFDEPFVLFPARGKAINDYHKIWLKLILPLLCIFYPVLLFVAHWHWTLLIAYSILLALTYLWVRRKFTRAILPIVEMRSDGIEIHSLHCDMFIPWVEIKEVSVFTIIEPHVGIVPYDLKRTLARGTAHTQMNGWLNAACVPIARLTGFFSAPLFILESELPLTAQEVVELINLRRAHALGLRTVTELGWDK